MDAMATDGSQPMPLMTTAEEVTEHGPRHIKVIHGALDERNGEIVLRGVITQDSLPHLKTDDYQREVLRPVKSASTKRRSTLKSAVINSEWLPDVELGMRGQNFTSGKGGTFYLHDDVYIIDGLQRISTVRDYNELNPDNPSQTQIGALIHFGTTKEFESKLFHILNANRTAMSPNVLLRNQRAEHASLLTLYGLCHNDKEFVLYGRVSWQQNMHRGQITTAMNLLKITHALHRHIPYKRVARTTDSFGRELHLTVEAMAGTLGLRHLRENVKEFFQVVEDCYGLRSVEYRELSVQTKGNFLIALATVFSSHANFWRNNQLFVDAEMKKGLKNFPLHDPAIERMAGGGMMMIPTLVNLMIDHLNKRKKVNRLQARMEEKENA